VTIYYVLEIIGYCTVTAVSRCDVVWTWKYNCPEKQAKLGVCCRHSWFFNIHCNKHIHNTI